jgi:hypothetical protein
MGKKKHKEAPQPERPGDVVTEMERAVRKLAYGHHTSTNFHDFVEMVAISLSNAFDLTHREEREKRYLGFQEHWSKKQRSFADDCIC